MSEQKITAKIVKLLRDNDFLVQRLESRIMKGIPDINFCTKEGKEAWIEVKYIKTNPGKIPLSNEQFLWLRRRSSYNPNCFIVFYKELPDLWVLYRGTELLNFNENPNIAVINKIVFSDLNGAINKLIKMLK